MQKEIIYGLGCFSVAAQIIMGAAGGHKVEWD